MTRTGRIGTWCLAVGLLAALGIGVVAPAVIGGTVERELEDGLHERVAPGVTLRDVQIERGIWRTRVEAIVELENRLGERYYRRTGEPLLLDAQADVQHGPLVRGITGGWTPGFASARTTLKPPDAWADRLGEGRLDSRIGAGGRAEHQLELPAHRADATAEPVAEAWLQAFEWEDAQMRARVRGAVWDVVFESSSLAFRAPEAPDPAAFGTPPDGESGIRADLSDARFHIRREPGADEGYRYRGAGRIGTVELVEPASGRVHARDLRGRLSWAPGPVLPGIQLDVGGGAYRSWMQADDAARDQEPDSELAAWALRTGLEVTNDRAAVTVNGTLDARKPDPFRGALNGSLRGLHAPATADLARAAIGAWGSADPYHLGIAIGERLLARLPDLLEAQPDLALDARVRGEPGDARLQGALRYTGPSSVMAHQWQIMARGLSGRAELDADPAWFELFVVGLLRQELAAAGQAADAETEARLAEIAQEQIAMMQQAGWIQRTEDGGRLRSWVELENGRLQLNGVDAAVLPGAE